MVGSPACGAVLGRARFARTMFGRIIGGSPALSTGYQRLIPVHNRRPKENHEQGAGSQKRAERKFVVRIFALRRDDRDAEHASEQRARENGQQRSLRARETLPAISIIFTSPSPMPSRPAQPEIHLGNQPQKSAAYGRPDQRIDQRKDRRRRREREKADSRSTAQCRRSAS